VPKYIFSKARPKTEIYNQLVECNKEKEWDFLEEIVLKNRNKNEYKIYNDLLWGEYKNFCQTHQHDISSLSSKRFLYIFNRIILKTFDKNDKYFKSIEKIRSNSLHGYSINIDKLRDYFKIEKGDNFVDDDE
jgi:hypothetical protein